MWTLQRFLLQDCFIQVDQRQLSWTSAVTLIKEADCSRGLSYSSLNILWVTGGSKPTERKAKQSPATGLSVALNFWLSISCSWGEVSFTINEVFHACDQSLSNTQTLKRLFRWKTWNGKSWFPLSSCEKSFIYDERRGWNLASRKLCVPPPACVSWWMCTASSQQSGVWFWKIGNTVQYFSCHSSEIRTRTYKYCFIGKIVQQLSQARTHKGEKIIFFFFLWNSTVNKILWPCVQRIYTQTIQVSHLPFLWYFSLMTVARQPEHMWG